MQTEQWGRKGEINNDLGLIKTGIPQSHKKTEVQQIIGLGATDFSKCEGHLIALDCGQVLIVSACNFTVSAKLYFQQGQTPL